MTAGCKCGGRKNRSGLKTHLDTQRRLKEQADQLEAQTERDKALRLEEAKRVKAARRAASINVRSSPVRSAPKSMDDEMRAIWQRNHG